MNIGSLAALGPVPGLSMYAAAKHGVIGFTGSLQGDLFDAGIPITVHALCPDAADTPLLREHDHEPAAAINWSGPRLLSADEVAEHAVALLDSRKLVRVVPAWRGWGARVMSMSGRRALRAAPILRKRGNRHRVAFRSREHDRPQQPPPPPSRSRTPPPGRCRHRPGRASRGGCRVRRAARRRSARMGGAGFDGRAAVMKRCQKWISDNSQRVIETIMSETGKAYEEALVAEIGYAEAAFRFWAANAEKYLAEEKVRSASPFVKGRKLIVRYAPVGVVGVIGPWNYPLTNSFGDSIPAMMAGNSVLLKPSEVTPLTSMLMGEMLRECGLPENVYQVLPGYGETAAAMIDEVDFVMFTGSTATGRKVMERAAQTLTPVSLELGGKDPMIVCADADVERAANAAVHYSMQNAGQSCTSTERVYVEEPIYDEFVRLVSDRVRNLRQSAPAGPGSCDLGAVISPPRRTSSSGT